MEPDLYQPSPTLTVRARPNPASAPWRELSTLQARAPRIARHFSISLSSQYNLPSILVPLHYTEVSRRRDHGVNPPGHGAYDRRRPLQAAGDRTSHQRSDWASGVRHKGVRARGIRTLCRTDHKGSGRTSVDSRVAGSAKGRTQDCAWWPPVQ